MTNFYPPILTSTQSAFIEGTAPLNIYYFISDLMDSSRIGHIDIKVLRQQDNMSIVDRSKFPDGIIYQSFNKNLNYVVINLSDLNISSWSAGEIYKIQLRFGYGELWGDDLTNFATWKTNQINNGYFGEWSNVMMVKAISPVTLNTFVQAENTVMPVLCGSCESPSDPEEFYYFRLKDSATDEIIDESLWIRHTNERDQWQSDLILDTEKEYKLQYKIRTLNGYESDFVNYEFEIIIVNISQLEGITIKAEPNEEDGYNLITISLDPSVELTGNYIISRSTDGLHWEDLKFYLLSHEKNNIEYRDYCIESGIKYHYGFQYENSNHLRTERNSTSPIQCDFEYSYLFGDGVQLRLQFNNTLNSFKHTVLSSKQDTLGSKYPTILRNGYAYYGEFPISGLISYHENSDTFFIKKEDGLYYKDILILSPNRFYIQDETRDQRNSSVDYSINTNLISENIFIERKFREKVEEFLNNGNYKLFKSPTEGTMIVSLMNISLTPNQSLGRMIYSFQGTAYEIADFSIENLNSLGLISTGEWKSFQIENKKYERIGQAVSDSSNTDLLAQIQSSLGEDEIFYNLSEISIESKENGIAAITITTTNGSQEIFVFPNRIYHNDNLLSDNENIIGISATSTTPLILNYKYTYIKQETSSSKEIVYIALKDINYQLNLSPSADIINLTQEQLLSHIQQTDFSKGGYNPDSTSLNGDASNGYENEDGNLKVWYLNIEKINIQDAPTNTFITVGFEDNDKTISLGLSGNKTLYPKRDKISYITLPSAIGSMLIEAKVSLVYELLTEVNN